MATIRDSIAVYQKSFPMPASCELVFQALTDAEHLTQWFAEHVEVETKVGGAYRFWGRHTAWIESKTSADQTIIAILPPQRLAFRWTWRDTECDVDLRLEAHGSRASALQVCMTAGEARMGLGSDCEWYMSDFWRLSTGNLRAYLLTGAPALRPDYRAKGDGVDLSVFIAAPPSTVYRALTDPCQMDQWISAKAITSGAAGGAYSYGWTISHGDSPLPCGPRLLIAAEPHRLVEHDWHHGDEPPTRVRWELREVAGGTVVRLVHSRRIVEPEFGGYIGGWTSYLIELREFTQAITRGEASSWRSPAHATCAV